MPGHGGPGPSPAGSACFPWLRRKPHSRGLRAAALALVWRWLRGQGQVLSKHQVHRTASPPPLATEEPFLGQMGCSAGQASAGTEGRALPGPGTWQVEGSPGGLVSAPSPPSEIIFPPQPPCQPPSRATPGLAVGAQSHLQVLSSCLLVDLKQEPCPLWTSIFLSFPTVVAPLPYLSITATHRK